MLMNNLDPDVAEDPDRLVVYGGTGRAARSWEAFDAIVATLRRLGDDETLLVQSGKPVGRLPHARTRTARADRELAPRARVGRLGHVPAARGRGADDVRADDRGVVDLHRHPGDRAGHLRDVRGRRARAVRRIAARPARADRRLRRHGRRTAPRRRDERRRLPDRRRRRAPSRPSRRDALPRPRRARPRHRAARDRGGAEPGRRALGRSRRRRRRGLRGAARARRRAGRRDRPDVRARSARRLRARRATRSSRPRSCASPIPSATWPSRAHRWRASARRWCASRSAGRSSSTTATACGPRPARPASPRPSRTPASSRRTCGRCSARASARSAGRRSPGDPDDIAATDRAIVELFPENEGLQRWMRMAKERIAFQGLPARICWLGYGERHRAGLRINELVRSGEVTAPIVIGRDHLDSGSVASPYRETEGMRDGSDAIADWPLLNAMLNVSSGAAWVALHHGGGVGIGRSIHSGAQVVADGTDEGAFRVERVLTNDPGHGRDAARRRGLRDRARARAGDRARPADAPVTVLVPELVLGSDGACAAISRSSSPTGASPGSSAAGDAPDDAIRLPRRLLDPRTRERALARLPARAAGPRRAHRPGASRTTTSGRGARRCTRPRARSIPTASGAPARPASARRAPPATRPSASSTTSTTSRTARRTPDPNELAHAVCDAARADRASASCCC